MSSDRQQDPTTKRTLIAITRRATMKIRTIAATITAALMTLVLVPATAQADHESGHLRACGDITWVNCTSTVTNTVRGGYYCQRLDDGPGRCEVYWPFRNPTVNAHAAYGDPDAFPADYQPTKARAYRLGSRVDVLQKRLDRKNARIKILRNRVERLRNR